MELGDGLRKRLAELEKRFPDIKNRLADIAQGATLQAVELAVELTPPNTFEDGEQRGVNMISGEMAQHWVSDSSCTPVGVGFSTILANNMEYASYVNDGHRVDKHFVPGLYIDADGLLSRDLGRKCGLVVGTKTTYVEGLHITEKAMDRYDEVARTELDKLTGEIGQ
ncbi:MAG: HK97 gp10 family phage protein [Oscillospiraceae bacterium]|jgi:hypothetical protein|nr:HK97 gp10 family phage protein [Oscillospiraceae bacterium]